MTTIHVNDGGPPWIETVDGRKLYMHTPEGAEYARTIGLKVHKMRGPIGRTPPQDHYSDPLVTDKRPIRLLNTEERRAFEVFVSHGAYIATAGFETWRGADRWYYVDILGVGKDLDEASESGMPVGPVERDIFNTVRMVGSQLALRVLNPNGDPASS